MPFDTIIRGGTIATAADTFACDIAVRDGRIAALGHDLGAAETIIDATDRLVLPGGIDSHVHFAQPSGDGIIMADGFATGTRSAAFGGNTTVLPFCLQEKGQTLREALRNYHAQGPQRFRRADRNQSRQDLWSLSAQGNDCGGIRRRHRTVGSETKGHDPPRPCPRRLGLYTV